MTLAPPIVRSDRHRLREPHGEIRIRLRTHGSDVRRRGKAIPNALPACGGTFVGAARSASGLRLDLGWAHESGAGVEASANGDLALAGQGSTQSGRRPSRCLRASPRSGERLRSSPRSASTPRRATPSVREA